MIPANGAFVRRVRSMVADARERTRSGKPINMVEKLGYDLPLPRALIAISNRLYRRRSTVRRHSSSAGYVIQPFDRLERFETPFILIFRILISRAEHSSHMLLDLHVHRWNLRFFGCIIRLVRWTVLFAGTIDCDIFRKSGWWEKYRGGLNWSVK